MQMAKDRNRGNREPKKPKADKKPVQAGSTFLRPQPASPPPTPKGTTK
jgi:hypothetical protein